MFQQIINKVLNGLGYQLSGDEGYAIEAVAEQLTLGKGNSFLLLACEGGNVNATILNGSKKEVKKYTEKINRGNLNMVLVDIAGNTIQ